MDKETEVAFSTNAISITLFEATTNLADHLSQSEEFLRFKIAEAKLNADQEAQKLLREYSELQQKIRSQQNSTAIPESDYKRLRELQMAIGANETIQDFEFKQELAVAWLREINQEISQLLGIDFASFTRRSSGCC